MVNTAWKILKNVLIFLVTILFWPIKAVFPAKLKVEHIKVPMKGISRKWTIVHLSDFHWDFKKNPRRITAKLMQQILDTTNSLDVDLILLTGDYVQYKPQPIHEFASEYLSKFKARYGTFASLGNHDYKVQGGNLIITQALETAGIKVLVNQFAKPLGEEGPWIVGLADSWAHEYHPETVFSQLSQYDHIPRIVLSHNPDTAMLLRKWRVDLQLSGHTHGGQVCFPNGKPVLASLHLYAHKLKHSIRTRIFPRVVRGYMNVVKKWDWALGLHKIERVQPTSFHRYNMLYTTRGVATHPPLRLFCDPEVSYIELVPSEEVDGSGAYTFDAEGVSSVL